MTDTDPAALEAVHTSWSSGKVLGVVALATIGFGWCAYFLFEGHIGAAFTLAVPVSIGATLGYWFRALRVVPWLLALAVIGIIACGLVTMEMSGLFCGLILALMFVLPAFVGIAFGALLRRASGKRLPSVQAPALLLPILLLPALTHGLEAAWERDFGVHAITTRKTIPVTPEAAWKSMLFYEDIGEEPPLILKLGLPKPIRTEGEAKKPGDITVCVYDKGHLVKRVIEVQENARLVFEVIDQVQFENRSIRLKDGQFVFTRTPAGHTELSLTTRYEPLLSPRWYWRPVEEWTAHALHQHVIDTMATTSTSSPKDTDSADLLANRPSSGHKR